MSNRLTDAELEEVADMEAAVSHDAVITLLRIASKHVPKLIAEVKALRKANATLRRNAADNWRRG